MLTANFPALPSDVEDWRSRIDIEVSDRQLPVRMRAGRMRTRFDHGLTLRTRFARQLPILLVRSICLALFGVRR